MQYECILEYWDEDDGWFAGRLKGAPGVSSQGRTLEELEENIREAFDIIYQGEEVELIIYTKL